MILPYTVSVLPSFQRERDHQEQAYYIIEREARIVMVTSQITYEMRTSGECDIYTVNGDLKSRKIIAIAYCIADIYTRRDLWNIDQRTLQDVISAFSKSLLGHVTITYEIKDGSRTIHTFKDLKTATEAFTELAKSMPDKEYHIYEIKAYSHLESEKVI